MREKQRGPDILAKTSCSYQINKFLISTYITATGNRIKPTFTAYTATVHIRLKPNRNKPTMTPAAATINSAIINAVTINITSL